MTEFTSSLQLSTILELLEGSFYGMDLLKLHSVHHKASWSHGHYRKSKWHFCLFSYRIHAKHIINVVYYWQMVLNNQTEEKSNTSTSPNPQPPTSSPTTLSPQPQEKRTSLSEQNEEAAAFQHIEVGGAI